jgi:hypothetical protein
MAEPRDDDFICGESYDHTLKLIDERDGYATYECTECGAEVIDKPDDDDGESNG